VAILDEIEIKHFLSLLKRKELKKRFLIKRRGAMALLINLPYQAPPLKLEVVAE
jgi:hypothetical protein